MHSFTICGIINERGYFSLKKTLCILLAALVAIGLAACGAPTATSIPSFVATEAPAVVEFADPVLEAMVRGAIGQPEGGITLAQAQYITSLDLNDELQGYLSQETPIEDISGLEAFTNLESLDLSSHAVTDISPLEGLTSLTSLSLASNPVTDLSPLASLTNLKLLILSGSQAQDYSALANLVNLQVLLLDNSTITDLSPLTALTNLRALYLADSQANDYLSLTNIYSNLEKKDFTIPSTLEELGFYMNDERNMAKFGSENLDVIINHSEWGALPDGRVADCVWLTLLLENGYILKGSYLPDLKSYGFAIVKDGVTPMSYTFDTTNGNFAFESGDRESSEQAVRAAIDVVEGEDVLITPIRIFNDSIQKTFKMTTDALYSLPFEPPTLKSLRFFPDEANAVYLYEQRGEKVVNMEVHRPEWGEKEFDVRFFTPLSDEYRIVVTWHAAERKFIASVDDNSQGGGSFEYFIDTGEYVDIWCSYKDKTVEEYFIKAYNNPAITDIHQHSIDLMVNYVSDTFGMTIEELYSLPTGE
jgi:hypothetical protein